MLPSPFFISAIARIVTEISLALSSSFPHPIQINRHSFYKLINQNRMFSSVDVGFSKATSTANGRRAFKQNEKLGIPVDFGVYSSLLQSCTNAKALAKGKQTHARMLRSGFEQNVFLGTMVLRMYVRCGSLVYARLFFDRMTNRDGFSWTAMIGGYARNDHCEEAQKLFRQLQLEGSKPDPFTIVSVLPACANLANLKQGKEIQAYTVKNGFDSNVFVGSSLVDMYTKCGETKQARHVFDKMSQRDVALWNGMIAGYVETGLCDEASKLFGQMQMAGVNPNVASWTTIIVGCTRNGQGYEALKFFRQMQLRGLIPDPVTIASILPACSHLASLQHGRDIHLYTIKSGFRSDVFVGSCLVDMYAKCGSIEDARQVFDKMSQRDVVAWTVMIAGYAVHGYGEEAIGLFYQMQRVGMKPNSITFTGVLSACSHSGLIEEGWRHFDGMSRDYGIAPSMQHYTCMVDLLGRAGSLDEAQDFMNRMPLEPNAAVWGALLGACRIHCNIELGERVAERLFELEPENSGIDVLLSNIYAAAGKWDDVAKVRKRMKDNGIKKLPGCSWIEVKNKVHAFYVGDKSHPQAEKIYAMLTCLDEKMKDIGYVPDTNFVLHDVEEEKKECILCSHSEKLAIAFGLINTCAGTPIRIIKNLRVCGDCHTATKLISKIVRREIIVRDPNRFHHVKEGHCSCGDYW